MLVGGYLPLLWRCALAWLQDFHYALRSLRNAPGFTLVAVLSLTLGIGLNSAVFSLVDAVFLRSWPARDPARLVRLVAQTQRGQEDDFSYPEYLDLSSQSQQFSGIAAYSRHGRLIGPPTDSRFIGADIVSPNYFSILGLAPAAGRFFDAAARPSEGNAVVFSNEVWQKDFGGDRGLVGRTVMLSGSPHTVIGIAPPGFRGLTKLSPSDAWLSIPDQNPNAARGARDFRDYELFARLRNDVSPEKARAELAVLSGQYASAFPDTEKGRSIVLISESQRLAQALWPALSFLALATLVLIVACANVATLMLARAETRRREIAVRTALGAKRVQLFRLLLTEGLLVSAAGAAFGLLLTWMGARMQLLFAPPVLTFHADLRLNAPVLFFTTAVTLATAVVFGLAPLAVSARADLVSSLKVDGAQGGGRSAVVRNLLVTVQIALALAVLCATGLVLRSLLFSSQIETGFQKDKNLAFFTLAPGIAGYEGQRTVSLMQELSQRTAALPGVKQACFARRALLSGSGGGATVKVSIPGEAPELQNVQIKFNAVSVGYFQTVGTGLVRGRDFTAADAASAPVVVVVSQTMAQRYWSGPQVVGRHLLVNGRDAEVIGVAEDATINSMHERAAPYLYTAFAQFPNNDVTLMVETASNPSAVIPAVREAIRGVNKSLPVLDALTLRQLLHVALWEERISALLVSALGLVGILLAMVGLYGVIAYFVYCRAREIGVRIALGAQRSHVRGLVIRQGWRLVLPGTMLGLALALATTRFIGRYLYGVKPADPVSFAGAALLVIAIALAACFAPARRACKVDPIVALRSE